MAKIREYNPTLSKVNPSDRAIAAWETAGRRVGPLYNQAAQDIKEAGRVKGEMERAKSWPFDIYALEAYNAPKITTSTSNEVSYKPGSTSGGGGGGSRGRSYDDWDWAHPPTSPRTTAEAVANAQIAGGGDGSWGRSHGEASAGAVGMSRLARAMAHARGYDDKDITSGRYEEDMAEKQVAHEKRTEEDYQRGRAEHEEARAEHKENIEYRDRMRERSEQDRARAEKEKWQDKIDKWNRKEDQYWNGPNGWNTRREKMLDDDRKAWQKDLDNDHKIQQQMVDRYMKKKPDANEEDVRRGAYESRHVFPTSPGRDYGGGAVSTPDTGPGYSGSRGWMDNAIDSVKSTFGSMFGSVAEDNEEDDD
jgi:hypothetical protein